MPIDEHVSVGPGRVNDFFSPQKPEGIGIFNSLIVGSWQVYTF